LWALNQNNWSSSGPASNASWSITGSDQTVTLSYPSMGQGIDGTLILTVTNYASVGPATWPTITSNASLSLPDGRTVTKILQATTTTAPLFGNAIASSGSYVAFSGGGVVDSWNSHPTPPYSGAATAYSFTAGNPTNYQAVVAGNDNGTNGVIINQAQINGYLASFGDPASYSTSGSPPGRVQGPATPGGVNVDSMRLGTSAFVPTYPTLPITFPATSGPYFGGLIGNIFLLITSLLGLSSPQDTLETTGSLTIDGNFLTGPNMTISQPTRIIVNGSFTISSVGQLTITNTGSLQLFVTGRVRIGGNGINNLTKDPRKMAIFCTDTSGFSMRYTATTDYYGVIYCPYAPISIQSDADLYGALLTMQSINFTTSSPSFHYDTFLRKVRFSGVSTPFIVDQLTEL
jgi:hypothetical protein